MSIAKSPNPIAVTSETQRDLHFLYNGKVTIETRYVLTRMDSSKTCLNKMGSHPINLTIRFLLELIALISMGIWGWKQSDGVLRFILAFGIPIIAAAIWGTFAVPDDPSRSGAAPIVTPGIIRLFIELAFFVFATWSLYSLGYTSLSWILGLIVIVHYIVSYDRIMWLLKQ